MKPVLLLVAVCTLVLAENGPGLDKGYTYKQVCELDGKIQVLDGIDCRKQIALGRWQNSMNASGWTYFEAETHDNASPEVQAYSAGYLEGVLSKTLISYHIYNTLSDCYTNFTGYCGRLNAYLTENSKWINETLEAAQVEDPYWQAINRTYYQLSGLIDGYEGRTFTPRITYELHPIFYLNIYGDMYDLKNKLARTTDPDEPAGRCSGLIKVSPGNKDLFISHVAMSGYQDMLRVLKLYKFAYNRELYPGYGTTMSSYPGFLFSCDDFALMTSGLAVIETTYNVYYGKMYNNTQPRGQLLAWIRTIVSNQLARNAREWCQIYSRYNSGTYNNQWVILDYNTFTPGQPLPNAGLVYVLEQLPGKIVYRDMTWFIKKYSYFPSYNLPYFKEISEDSGSLEMGKTLGDWFIWGKSPRARIFDRDHGNVVDLDSLTTLMRSNNYQKDPFSRCDCTPPYSAEAAISPRGDLNLPNGTYQYYGHINHGSRDYKGTNVALARQLRFRAWGGPTWAQQPPFDWRTCDFPVKHVGHPDLWKFEYVEHKWETEVKMDSLDP